MQNFKRELTSLLNRHSVENQWDMPDFLMAKLIVAFIESVGPAMKKNLDWHGVDNVCHPKHAPVELNSYKAEEKQNG